MHAVADERCSGPQEFRPGVVGGLLARGLAALSTATANAAAAVSRRSATARLRRQELPPPRRHSLAEALAIGLGCDGHGVSRPRRRS